MEKQIKMPQLGQTSDAVRLLKWLVKEGQQVQKGQPLCEVETDKVTMELESVAGGKVLKLLFEPDSEIKTGDTIILIDDSIKTARPKDDGVSPKEAAREERVNVSSSEDNKQDQDYASTPVAVRKLSKLSAGQKKKIISEIGTKKAITMLRKMLEIRKLEEKIQALFLEGKMPGTIHQYIGMEACASGVCSALEHGDIIASTHRPHGHAVAKGIPMKEILAELYGKVTGCCKGKGGSMHLGDIEKGVLPAVPIVGGNIPMIGGIALSFKLRKIPNVAVSFFGDGASNEGAFHEALNMAAIYEIPAVFVCENNLYGASTSIKKTLKLENIADRVCAYGMRGDIADGMDVLEVYAKAKTAVDIARQGKGPTLLELKTFRFCGHSRTDPCNYMGKEEKAYWKSKDPIDNYEAFLLSENVLDKSLLENLKNEVDSEVDKAVDFAINSPLPDPLDTYEDLYVNMEVPR